MTNLTDDYAYKVVCFNDENPFGFEVVEDLNVGSINEACVEIRKRIEKHDEKDLKWILLPINKTSLTA